MTPDRPNPRMHTSRVDLAVFSLANDVLEELYAISMQTLQQQGATQDASSIAIVFKSVVTSMLQIGAGLSHSRELR